MKNWKGDLLKRKRLVAAMVIIALVLALGFIAGLTLDSTRRIEVGEYESAPRTEVTVTQTATLPAIPGKEVAVPSAALEVIGRKIVYDARVSLEVRDVDSTVNRVKTIAEELRGYVSEMSVSKGDKVKTGSVTLKVPQADFYTAIQRVEQLGQVKDKKIGSMDVTERYVDLKARLENAQRQEQRLLELMGKASQVSDVLNVERELGRIREQIELYTGQLNFLERRVEYSMINVTLSEPNPPQLLPEADWGDALRTGLWGLLVVSQGLIILGLSIIPLAVVGVPIYYVYMRWRRKKSTTRS